MKFCYKEGEIELHNGYVQLMLDCLVQWMEGESDPDEADSAVDLRNDLINDFNSILRKESSNGTTSDSADESACDNG